MSGSYLLRFFQGRCIWYEALQLLKTKEEMLYYMQLLLQPKQINLTMNHFRLKEIFP